MSVDDTTLGTLAANPGLEKVVMPKPAFIGDTLQAETKVAACKDSKSLRSAGIVTFQHVLLNQREEIICQCLRPTLLHRSPR